MKLYATITSERASKGQGGKYLSIVIKDEEMKPVFYLYVVQEKDEITLRVDEYDGVAGFGTSGYRTTFRISRGKQQKGEDEYSCSCNEGGKTENHVFWSNKNYRERGNPVCPYCDSEMYLV